MELDASNTIAKIQATMYGVFFEDINFAADGGLYAEMIKNRGFEFENPIMGWHQPNSDRHSLNMESGIATIIKTAGNASNRNFNRVLVNNDEGYELINEGFRGMGIKQGATYNLSLMAAKGEGNINRIHVEFIDKDGKSLGKTSISPNSGDWKKYEARLKATATEAKARVKITFEGKGTVDLDMISCFRKIPGKAAKGACVRIWYNCLTI